MRHSYLRSMAMGWKALSFLGIAWFGQNVAISFSGSNNNALIGAYLRKYQNHSATDPWEHSDRKREYY